MMKKTLPAFTLPEMLMAVSIFAIVSIVIGTLYVHVFRSNRKTNLENQLYEDARYILEVIADEIRKGTIDYEEYYNRYIKAGIWGGNYGAYSSAFFDPGTDGLGFRCTEKNPDGTERRNDQNCTPVKNTLDTHTGQKDGNVFCEGGQGNCSKLSSDELYLIRSDGRMKTILAKENIGKFENDIYVLSLVRLEGEDTNDDGVYDVYQCQRDFNCENNLLPRTRELELINRDADDRDNFADFVPLTPYRTEIKNLQFYIAPLENPHVAFLETDTSIRQQPHVSIVLTVGPNKEILKGADQFQQLTLVKTVESRLLSPVPAPLILVP